MNKAILIPIQPEPVAKILNGDKTVLICKTAPKCDLPIDVYIYCTKGKIGAWFIREMKRCFFGKFVKPMLNGKVVATFTLGEVESTEGMNSSEGFSLLGRACIDYDEFLDYTDIGTKPVYAWHISDLEILDEPKELREFFVKRVTIQDELCEYCTKLGFPCSKCYDDYPLTKAPRNWRYVEVE